MNLGDIQRLISADYSYLKSRYYVKKIGIFGSFARGESTGNSDVDLLVEFDGPVGWEVVDLKEHLENLLGKKVDLVTEKALKPLMKEEILREVVYS